MNTLTPENLRIRNLGNANFNSPLSLSKVSDDDIYDYILDSDRILYNDTEKTLEQYKNNSKKAFDSGKSRPP